MILDIINFVENENGSATLEINMDEKTNLWLINYAIIEILKNGLNEVEQLHKEDINVKFSD